jgi:DNA-binding MarR family transcriptional regulator
VSDADRPMPVLLRFAWQAYADAVVGRLEEAGIDDLPRHGSFVLGGMAHHAFSASDVVQGLGISKQRASQLIDTLVLRGYLSREPNPQDRRRTTIRLTARGSAAAEEIRTAVVGIDTRLAELLDPHEREVLRKGLGVLTGMRSRTIGR